jgi:hypothetical protein
MTIGEVLARMPGGNLALLLLAAFIVPYFDRVRHGISILGRQLPNAMQDGLRTGGSRRPDHRAENKAYSWISINALHPSGWFMMPNSACDRGARSLQQMGSNPDLTRPARPAGCLTYAECGTTE